ncbi:MAG: hypothetical protein IT210_14585 [Armatimonadetes bacterium]|nr:hypothetical protein [Armatimonadota bacterium]
MTETIVMLFVLVILLAVSTPLLAVWLILRYKLQRLHMEEAIREQRQTNDQLRKLQNDYEEFLLGFDATLKRLDSRLSKLEDRQAETRPDYDTARVRQETADNQEIRTRRNP